MYWLTFVAKAGLTTGRLQRWSFQAVGQSLESHFWTAKAPPSPRVGFLPS